MSTEAEYQQCLRDCEKDYEDNKEALDWLIVVPSLGSDFDFLLNILCCFLQK